jgi:hypothetical protein
VNDAGSREDDVVRCRTHQHHSSRDRLRHGPLAAMLYVARATSPAVAELAREFIAASDAVREAARNGQTSVLLAAIFDDGLSRDELKRLANEQLSAQLLFQQLQLSFNVLQQQSPGDVDHYRALVLAAAERAAAAVRETRYFGRGRVTAAERQALDEIRRL